jgi:hypothetical protein
MTTIPLNKLDPAKANVRKTGAKDGIEGHCHINRFYWSLLLT